MEELPSVGRSILIVIWESSSMCTCLTLNKKQIQPAKTSARLLVDWGSNSKYPEPAIIVYKNKTSGPRRSLLEAEPSLAWLYPGLGEPIEHWFELKEWEKKTTSGRTLSHYACFFHICRNAESWDPYALETFVFNVRSFFKKTQEKTGEWTQDSEWDQLTETKPNQCGKV